LSRELRQDARSIVADGIGSIGNYHIDKALYYDDRGRIVSDNFSLLYYYHNRLSTYGLKQQLKWPTPLVGDERKEA
jgi:glycerol-3-phosphate O-acyltransferase